MTSTTETLTVRHRQANPLAFAVFAWALAYGTLRAFWALGHQPSFPPMGFDLLGLTGWPVVVLCALAAGLGPALARAPRSRVLGWVLPAAAGIVAAALVAGAGLLLLDLVGVLFPGLDLVRSYAGMLSRVGCLASLADRELGSGRLAVRPVGSKCTLREGRIRWQTRWS